MDIKDLIYDHSVKLQIIGSVVFFFMAQTPIEYFLGFGLLLHAFLDWRDGMPLI
jgi:hypothetical protein